jgi:hypothetical protein
MHQRHTVDLLPKLAPAFGGQGVGGGRGSRSQTFFLWGGGTVACIKVRTEIEIRWVGVSGGGMVAASMLNLSSLKCGMPNPWDKPDL